LILLSHPKPPTALRHAKACRGFSSFEDQI
jgi:hypothetical protein